MIRTINKYALVIPSDREYCMSAIEILKVATMISREINYSKNPEVFTSNYR